MAQNTVSRQVFGYSDESWKFNPLHVLGESVSLVLANWKLLARWAALPFALVVAATVPLPHAAKGGIFALLWKIASPFLNIWWVWISMTFSIRMYRLFLLGEIRPEPYRKQMFQSRTGTYFMCGFKVFLAMAVYSPVFFVCVFLVPSPLTGFFTDAANGVAFSLEREIFLELIFIPFWLYICPYIVLLFPDAASDGKGEFFATGAMGALARWRIAAVYALVWLPWFAVSHCWQWLESTSGTKLAWLVSTPEGAVITQAVLQQVVSFVLTAIGCAAGALVYRHLKAGWRVVEATPAAPAAAADFNS